LHADFHSWTENQPSITSRNKINIQRVSWTKSVYWRENIDVQVTKGILIFFFLKIVHWFFLLVKLNLFVELVSCLVFVRGTSYGLINVHKTCCLLIFVRGTCWVLLSVRESFFIVDFSLLETCTFLSAKLILVMELVACSFYSWNFDMDFSPRESYFFHRITCMLIFCLWDLLCGDFLFVSLVACWFSLRFLFSSIAFKTWFCPRNPLCVYFWSWTYCGQITFCSWNFLFVDFWKLCTDFLSSWNCFY